MNQGPKSRRSISAFLLVSLCLVVFAGSIRTAAAQWRPAETPLMTRWGKTVTPENAWQVYPRPQMQRSEWKNLNGLWDYVVTDRSAAHPGDYSGKILVPYPIKTPLSGVGREVTPDQAIWYQRTFEIPSNWTDRRVLLHFEAVDWEAGVWVNGREIGFHRGGYDPFSFDVTDALTGSGEQELIVRVWDPGPTNFQSLGKQANPSDTYEACSGIWQTVWLEPVSQVHINRVKITPDLEAGEVVIETLLNRRDESVSVEVESSAGEARRESASRTILGIENPRLWSPEDPHLYPLTVQLTKNGQVVDRVRTYFGMRQIEIKQVGDFQRILLNGTPIFQFGPLDQNYWPESGLTPPSDEAARWELAYLKEIGCNMVRLHIKQNPRRWYYHCDQLGLLVWQDFVSAQKQQKNPSVQESRQWFLEQQRLVDALYNHPSIVKWIVFNESWGQHDSERITRWVMEYDPSRLVSVASGWDDVHGFSDIRDIHDYTLHTSIPVAGSEPNRAIVLGEYGGINSVVPGHNWYGMGTSGAKREITPMTGRGGGMWPNLPVDGDWVQDFKRPTYTTGEALGDHLASMVDDLRLLTAHGLCGTVYTQLTDMKHEQNGWLSFDREVSKVPTAVLRKAHQRLYEPAPQRHPITNSNSWRYSTEAPAGDSWVQPSFDDSSWPQGDGPFGNTPLHEVSTEWKEPYLFLRKAFDLERVPDKVGLELYLFGQTGRELDDCKIYLNGVLINDSQTRHRKPELRVTAIQLRPEARALLRRGNNLLAVEVSLPRVDPRLFEVRLIEVTGGE